MDTPYVGTKHLARLCVLQFFNPSQYLNLVYSLFQNVKAFRHERIVSLSYILMTMFLFFKWMLTSCKFVT